MKQSKFMLYTDTYGPNYRYTTALPKFVDGDGAVAANAIQLAVQSRGGQDSIADLGPIGGIDAAKAFGIEAEDVALAETVTSSKRVDGSKQAYYEWELLCPTGSHILISACISGGGLYVFSAEATETQWRKNADALRRRKEFRRPGRRGGTLDISDPSTTTPTTEGSSESGRVRADVCLARVLCVRKRAANGKIVIGAMMSIHVYQNHRN